MKTAVGVSQESVLATMIADPAEFKLKLADLGELDASSFWFFVLDTPDVQDPAVVKKYQQLRKLFGDTPSARKMIDGARARVVAKGH